MTVLGDWHEEFDAGEWWVVSQGSNGEGEGGSRGRRGRRGSGRKRRAPSGWPGSSSSSPGRRRRPTSGRPWRPGTTGTTGMPGMTRGTRLVTRGRGVTRGVRWGVTRGVRRKGTWWVGVRRGVPGARMSPGNPPPRRRGNLRVATREWGPGGAGGRIGLTELIGLTHHQVTRRRPAK